MLKIGYDPKYVNVAEEIIKKKNLDIVALRNHLKLQATKDTLTKDIKENEA